MPAKLLHDFVFNEYANENYIMKSIYKNCMTKDDVICPKGHEIKIRFNNFKHNSHRCNICSNNVKYSHEFVYSYYKENYYIMNSIYNGNKTKDKLTCPVGHKIEISFHNFKNHNRRCGKCFLENNKCENHRAYNKDRTRKRRIYYLGFSIINIDLLKDDPNYTNYLLSQKEAKESDKNWDRTNYAIDHIFPRIAFIDNNLDNIYGETLIKELCNSRDNLRIILKEENGSKGGKYDREEFMKWFENKIKGN